MLRYLGQKAAQQLDVDLMSVGLSCAEAIHKIYPRSKVLLICGPGNNGGDGLVCARHLKHFGHQPIVYYPKRPNNDLYKRLVTQLEQLQVQFVDQIVSSDLIVDAIFGFSFQPPIRQPFDQILQQLRQSTTPIVSIDIPSGWHVENETKDAIEPEMLISLTAPKPCARFFKGKYHFIGGRFVPPFILEKYQLTPIPYVNAEQSLQVSSRDFDAYSDG
ncbi:apolipo protein A-I-binding protein [Gorgonomyces haynaldii]|nr:apolipo protein A-I-binding protein [Gorgonomyces haynaldii]